jgi:hypothetical protein
MDERTVFDATLRILAALGAVTFVALLFVVAPYGRHVRRGFGPSVNGTLGWVLMESVAALVPPALFLAGEPAGPVPWVFLGLWELHYLYRAFVYPFQRRSAGSMPAIVVGLGLVFNLANGWLNGRWLSHFAPPLDVSWLAGPRFLVGLALFVAGFVAHVHSDRVLLALRARGDAGYAIPQRGLHRLVASPNYLGELVQWIGFAVLTASPAAAVFALWTAANLVPRAVSNLRWYRETFPEYPRGRRALVPFVL